ncbi:MAG TPA: phage/plasmid primase, P4 family [Thauera aminoaromatica]|nr:phage/plasmid primase, P4 family [Thauera aminoaromatica]
MSAIDLRRQLTDVQQVLDGCGYRGEIVKEGRGVKIRCPWHADDGRPNLQISMRSDGTLGVKCFSCQKGGDILHLIGELTGKGDPKTNFKAVAQEAERIAGTRMTSAPAPRTSSTADNFPDKLEVAKFWNLTVDLQTNADLCNRLTARHIDPQLIKELARALPDLSKNPRWGWVRNPDPSGDPLTWAKAGYRLIVPMYDEAGELVSVHARRFLGADDKQKGTSPSRCRIAGSMMLSPAALQSAVWDDVIFVEGVPNYLILASLYPTRPVVGVISGSIKGCTFPRIPRGASVTVWMDADAQRNRAGQEIEGAGQIYTNHALAALRGRRIRVVKLAIPEGKKKAPDANDIYIAGGGQMISDVLSQAETNAAPLDPKAEAMWNRGAGVYGMQRPPLNMDRLEDREIVRLIDSKLETRRWNEFGELIGIGEGPGGWFANQQGLHFLRTGEAPPAGIVVTQGFENFLALSQLWDDDAVAMEPAILAGLPPKTTSRLVLWPSQPCEQDHEVVRASEPRVAAERGNKAMFACLSAAQPVPTVLPIPPSEKEAKQFMRTDLGNAERLAHLYGDDIHYVKDWDSFLVWDGKRWARDRTFEVDRRAAYVVRQLYDGDEKDRAWAHDSESAGKLSAMVSIVRKLPGVPILHEQLDADLYLLSVANGTLDLRTGELLTHSRDHLHTKRADVIYDRKAKCPKWHEFLRTIFDGNTNLISYIQRAAGYSLTGDVGEHVLFMLYGTGRNGKSTFLMTLQSLLADYSKAISSEVLMSTGRKLDAGQQSAIASLRGARFVVSSETEEGAKFSESVAKQLTKGDIIQAKFMGRDVFDFTPTHKLWLATNHRPKTRGKDDGLWTMLIPVPFTVTIPIEKRDRTLPAQLLAERSGILNWALDGCLDWQVNRLGRPAEIDAAVNSYRKEMDQIGPFIEQCCIVGADHQVKISALRKAYESWCSETSKEPLSVRTFGSILEEKFPADSTGDYRFRRGLMLRGEWVATNERN